MHPLSRNAAALALVLAACDGDLPIPAPLPPPVASPVRVSGASPFAPGCGGAPQRGVRYRGSEVEPHLAVHPANPDHLVAAWQQDRWSNGGAEGLVAGVSLDGGLTWTLSPIPFSRCAGGGAPDGDYERATDPWVSFSSDGAVVHAIGLALDGSTARRAIVASRSTDGGLTWSPAQALATDADLDVALDKPSLTADPARAGFVYAVWDRLTGLTAPDPAVSTGPAFFSRSVDGGVTWEQARPIHDPGADAQTISSQIVALPDGGLVNVFVRITRASTPGAAAEVVAMRSADAGESWSEPVPVAALQAIGAVDPKSGHPVRSGEVVPSSASDAAGTLWVAWQDARFSGGARDGVALAASADGGLAWSAPVQVNRAPAVQAFRPAVAAAGGEVAVTYYDFRHDVAGDRDRVWTTSWRATTADGGATWQEIPEGGPFDLRTAPDAGGWFLGDYTGLVPRRDGFAALFAMGRSALGDGTDVFASGPPGAVAAGAGAAPPGRAARPFPLAERLRAVRELSPR